MPNQVSGETRCTGWNTGEIAGVQKPFLEAPLPGPYIHREVCPSAREAGDTPIQLEPGWGLEFPNAFMLEFQHQSEGASEARLAERTAPPLEVSGCP